MYWPGSKKLALGSAAPGLCVECRESRARVCMSNSSPLRFIVASYTCLRYQSYVKVKPYFRSYELKCIMGNQDSKKLRDDAGLVDQSLTVDNSSPTTSAESFVVARENPVNDREYVMKKSSGTNDAILLSSKVYDKDDLILGFDVLSHVKTESSIYASAVESDGLNDHDDQDEKGGIVICRVACDESRRNWTVYWINKQTYPGQVAIDSSSSGPRLYNRMKIVVSEGRHTALVKQYGTHSNPKDDAGVLEDAGILKLEKPIGLSELIATHYYTLLPGEDKESAKPIAKWQWTNNILSHTIDMQVTKGADLSLHFVLLVVMNIVQRDNVFGITQSGDEI